MSFGPDPLYANSGIAGKVGTSNASAGGESDVNVDGGSGTTDAGDDGAAGDGDDGEGASDGGDAGDVVGGDADVDDKETGDGEKGDSDGLQQGQENAGAEEESATADEVAEAKRIIELVKADPEKFAEEFGVDTFGPRFAALAKQSAGLRKREQELKVYEQRVREADELLASLKRDPVAFAEEHLGQDGYERWTAAILGKGSESALVDKLMARIDGLEKKLSDAGQSTADSNQVVYERQAAQFWQDYQAEIKDESYERLRVFVGSDDELQKEVMAVQGAALEAGRWLTPREILGTLKEELDARYDRLKPASRDPAVEGSGKSKPAPKDGSGPATVTKDMRSTVGRLSDDPEWDKLPEREQLRRIAAKYAG